MESAGKFVDDEEAQEAMRGSGLGTAATRTETISKLLRDRYLVRKGRELHATPKAMALKKLLEQLGLDVLASPKKQTTYSACIRWITETGRYEVFFDHHNEPPSAEHPQIGVCRHCGGAVHEQPTRYVCVNATDESPRCGFALRKLWCGRAITTVEAEQLLANGRTELLEGFRSKKDRPFKAWIVVTPRGTAGFEFPGRQGGKRRSQ